MTRLEKIAERITVDMECYAGSSYCDSCPFADVENACRNNSDANEETRTKAVMFLLIKAAEQYKNPQHPWEL